MNRQLYFGTASQQIASVPYSKFKAESVQHYQQINRNQTQGQLMIEQSRNNQLTKLIYLTHLLREQNNVLIQALQQKKIAIDPKIISCQKHIQNISQQIQLKLAPSNLAVDYDSFAKKNQQEKISNNIYQKQIGQIQKRKNFLQVANGQIRKSRSKQQKSVLKKSSSFLSKNKQIKEAQSINVQFQNQNAIFQSYRTKAQIQITNLKSEDMFELKQTNNMRYSCNYANYSGNDQNKQYEKQKQIKIKDSQNKMNIKKFGYKNSVQKLRNGMLRVSARLSQQSRIASPRISNNLYR